MLRKIVHRAHRTGRIRMMMKQEEEKRVMKDEERKRVRRRKKNQRYKCDSRLVRSEEGKVIC
jgi:hypothetical protein